MDRYAMALIAAGLREPPKIWENLDEDEKANLIERVLTEPSQPYGKSILEGFSKNPSDKELQILARKMKNMANHFAITTYPSIKKGLYEKSISMCPCFVLFLCSESPGTPSQN